MTSSPLEPLLTTQGHVVLDGGLATALEGLGHSLDDVLWSARLLAEAPDAIRQVHRAYLEAGADCVTTASYQATLQGFAEAGYDHDESVELLRRSVRLAAEARDAFWAEGAGGARSRPLVAASVGPYGAYLADGSEYGGRYGLDEASLADFHRERIEVLADTDADLLAIETIPSLPETRALVSLLERAGRWAWISFSCADAEHLADGTPVADAVRVCAGASWIAAIGVNCVRPSHAPGLVQAIRAETDLPIVCYPNSGESWDAATRAWRPAGTSVDWGEQSSLWLEAGATVVGGCCRVGPREIRALRTSLRAAAG